MAESGEATLGDYLRDLPMNLAGGVGISEEMISGQDAGPEGANLGSGQGVNLRALGALSTLVLINGRRSPAAGQFGDFVDLSMIPAAAIDRVEVLPDGASAVYGSDAIGGVVNVIFKRAVEGPVTTLRVGSSTQGGGEEAVLSQLFGGSGESSSWLVGAEYYTRDSVIATDRAPYESGSDFSGQGGNNWRAYTAHYSPMANLLVPPGGGVGSPATASVPQGSNAALTNADLLPGVLNTTNVYEALDFLPDVERLSAFGTFDLEVSDRLSFNGELLVTNRQTDYDLGYPVLYNTSVPRSSPFYIQDINPAWANANGSIPFSVVVDDRPETREVEVDSVNVALGADFSLTGSWQLATRASYGNLEQHRVRHQLANVALRGQLNFVNCALQGPATTHPGCAALGLMPFNPFSTDPVSDAQLDQLFGFEDLQFDSRQWQVTAKADGDIFDMPGGPAKLAVGVDYRDEEMDGFLSWNTGSLDVRSGPYTKTQRDAISAFAEIALPVSDALQFSLAGRYEKFSGTGDYDSTDPKIGFDWQASESFTVRGTWGTSFHAPPMRYENDDPQPLPGGNAAFLLPVTYFGPCDSTLVDFNGIRGTPGTPGQSCSYTVIINSGGAGPGVLEPEEATTWTVGFDFTPEAIPGFTASLSYFNIEIDERIQRIQSGTLPGIVAEMFATGNSPFAAALNIRPDPAEAQRLIDSAKFLGTFGPPLRNRAEDVQMIVNATQINIARLETSGFDFSVSYDWTQGNSDLGVFLHGTWLNKYDTEAAPGAGVIDQLGKYSSFGAPVDLNTRAGLRFSNGPFDGTLTLDFTSSYDCAVGSCFEPGPAGRPVANTRPLPIDSWVTLDLNVGWDLAQFGPFGEGTTLRLTVINLLDEEPPFLDGGTGLADPLPSAYDPNNATLIGRVVALTLRKAW